MHAAATVADIAAFSAVWVLLAVIFGSLWHAIHDNNQPPEA